MSEVSVLLAIFNLGMAAFNVGSITYEQAWRDLWDDARWLWVLVVGHAAATVGYAVWVFGR